MGTESTRGGDLLKGKVILITGGTSGIGRATVLRAVREGASVGFTGRREEEGRKVEAEANAVSSGSTVFIRADHTREADSKRRREAAAAAAAGRAAEEGRLAHEAKKRKANAAREVDVRSPP